MYSIRPSLKGFRVSRSESQFCAFKILIQVLPAVGKAIEDPATDIDTYLMQVCQSAVYFSIHPDRLRSCKRAQMTPVAMTFEGSRKKLQYGSI